MNLEQIIRDYLPQIQHMSLGTSKDNKPWVCEVHYAYDDNLNLYFRSLTSRRHSQEIAANPYVAGNIVKQHPLEVYPLGVYFEGQAQLLTTAAERQTVFPYIKEQLHQDEAVLEDAKNPEGHQFYKITVDNWYVFGKLDDTGGKKYELKWNGGKK
ncbi:MAG TPA: pyridoxamine 5'-phosphate oxidase family protein [Candidatus Saccharimonadales bacterium]|nr:pyridoxamine 5'-phosphate oxidase family protein [Candidatus Saccharimonadales bacterium]